MMDWLTDAVLQLARSGRWAPVLFVVAYVVGTVLLAPAVILTVTAGAVFGLWRGTLYVYLGVLLGSSTVYAMAAPLARLPLLHRLDRDVRVNAVRRAVAGHELWVMFLLRLSPIVPYNLLNYALAFSGVRYSRFLLASVGMLPAILMYVYYGKVVGDVAKIAAGVAPPRGPVYYTLLIVGLIATALATTLVTRAARRAMAQPTPES